MTRPYHKRNDYSQPKYCACGCGMELTREQIRNGNKYASYSCAARVGNIVKAANKKRIACHCGCGEDVPLKNRKEHYYYVNANHEKLHRKQIEKHARQLQIDEYNNRNSSYCLNYKEGYSTCLLCYDNRDGMYRGCYGKPKDKRKN